MPLDWHIKRDAPAENNDLWRSEERDILAPYLSFSCTEMTGTDTNTLDVDVIVEKEYHLFSNGVRLASFFATPDKLKELAVGFLICEGFASVKHKINVKVEGHKLLCETNVDIEFIPGHRAFDVPEDIQVSRQTIFDMVAHLKEDASVWRRTGGTHSALICDLNGDVICFCEDVSRSCAVDKAVGTAILQGVDLSGCILVVTGRASETMVSKAINAGIPVFVTKAAPMSRGIELARDVGLTLIAFVRYPGLYIYSNKQRVL